jgi:hypothetical protein
MTLVNGDYPTGHPICPECGNDLGWPADEFCPRWDHDPTALAHGWVTDKECGNCGAELSA